MNVVKGHKKRKGIYFKRKKCFRLFERRTMISSISLNIYFFPGGCSVDLSYAPILQYSQSEWYWLLEGVNDKSMLDVPSTESIFEQLALFFDDQSMVESCEIMTKFPSSWTRSEEPGFPFVPADQKTVTVSSYRTTLPSGCIISLLPTVLKFINQF